MVGENGYVSDRERQEGIKSEEEEESVIKNE